MAKYLTEAEKIYICTLYVEGESTVKLARKFDKTPACIRYTLKSRGIERRSIEEARGSIPEGEYKEIGRRYMEGESMASIAKSYGCVAGPIRKIIKKQNIDSRIGHRFTKTEESKIVESFKKGSTVKELSEHHKCDRSLIYKILDAEGCERRYKNNLTEEQELEICEKYQKGATQNGLTREHGFKTDGVIFRILEKHNIEKRDKIEELRLFTDEEEKAIEEEYAKGESPKALADKYNSCAGTMLNIVKRNGGKTRKSWETLNWGIDSENYSTVASLYIEDLKTTHEIAKIFDCSYDHVCNVLERMGVERRDYWALTEDLQKEVINGYVSGKSSYLLSREYDVSVQYVCNLLERNGVARRDQGVWGDSVQNAIQMKGVYEYEQETDYYIYSVVDHENHYKPGIAFSHKDRIRGRSDFYGDQEYLQIFPTRHHAYFFEQAVLEHSLENLPSNPDASFFQYDGSGEVREIPLEDLMRLIEWLNDELDELGLWRFAIAHVSMTKEQREDCHKLVESPE